MSTDSICPNCGVSGMSPFYEVRNVPIHSCLMMSTQQDALKFPRGDISLGFCEGCGFISNLAFDSSAPDYSSIYEDQQSFSPTFNAFAQNLASRLIKKYDLYNKDIVEIGCGKGDFLRLLCELGDNRGVGIDPACAKDRVQSEVAECVTFIQDNYSEAYASYHGDLVCCRHTLEHIYSTAEFVSMVRRTIGDRKETIVFFEVPDVTRILRDLAFWDIYYEHCSYFSPESLAHLFRSCDFELLDLYRDYGDQYLLIEARPVNKPSCKVHELEESLEQISGDVRNFSTHCRDRLDYWRQTLQQICAERKRTVVWGAGSKCLAFMTTLGFKNEIEYVVDINPYLHGKFIPGVGKEIMPPEFLKEYKPDVVIVMNPIYCDEIRQMLDNMGLTPEMTSV